MRKRLFSFFPPKVEIVPQHDPLLPRESRDDDIFLVSYPKSGNTWISFILANMIVEKLRLGLEVNVFNIHGFIPDIHMGREIPIDTGFFPFKRMIKSHSNFNPRYLNVIYLIRDPQSVMVSYHKFLTGLGLFEGDISTLIRNENLGISAWVKHITGWLDRIKPSTRFRLFKYEDFRTDPEKNTFSLAKLLGVILSESELKKVIENSSFEHMRKLEEQSGSLSLTREDKDFRFVREGKISGWYSELNENDLTYIRQVAGQVMLRFNYDTTQ